MTRVPATLLALALVFGAAPAFSAPPTVWESPTVGSDTSWSGELLLRQSVVVSPGATLRVLPGTTVRVEAGRKIGIHVLGRLSVEGTAAAPVAFLPEGAPSGPGHWEGIRLAGGRTVSHSLAGFAVSGARDGISLAETTANLSGGTFTACDTGIRASQKSIVAADNCAFDGNGDGVFLSYGGEGVFRGCRFTAIRGNGIVADKGAVFRASGCSFERGKTGVDSLTNSPCRIEGCSFASLEKGVSARQMGKNSVVERCSFENNGTGILASQSCTVEVRDSAFIGNQAALDVQEFSSPAIRNNRFERNQVAVNVLRKSRPEVGKNVFRHNRNAMVVNYSSYPKIAGNDFERNDMSVRLEKFQSGDWEERVGSRQVTGSELRRRGPRTPGTDEALKSYPVQKRIDAKGNYWGPDPDRNPAKGTAGKIWDGRKFGPVRYEDTGDAEFAIDVVDWSEGSDTPIPGAGPGKETPGKAGSEGR